MYECMQVLQLPLSNNRASNTNGEWWNKKRKMIKQKESGKWKRVDPFPYKQVKSKEYLEKGHEPLQGAWTHLETFVLVSILSLLSTLPLSPSINNITKLYNFIADFDNTKQRYERN
jgi:hypothetical protein